MPASDKYNLTMLRQRRKTDAKPDAALFESNDLEKGSREKDVACSLLKSVWQDYFRFAIYCILLAVPLYAITKSILKHDWVMVVIDALIVPVGFVHGLLLLFGYVD